MRIISGKYKGRRLQAPKKLPVRPTTDMAKEALFNIVNNNYFFSEVNVLDLFSGTGNISFEFASRGTTQIIAVDKNPGCVQYISKISEELDFDIQVVKSEVFSYLEKVVQQHDVIFADPPYNLETEDFLSIVTLVFEKELLLPDGVLIIEHSKHMSLESSKYFSYGKRYGGSVFSFFEAESGE